MKLVMDHKKALGRGLSSLIPGANGWETNVGSKTYLECPLEDIVTNPNQPRKLFDKGSLDELALSIEEKGILQPLLVRALGGGKYELIAGERRLRAARQVGLEKVPVVIKNIGEEETLELALIENIQREELNPIEEALAYRDLLSKFQYTQDELAKRIGKDRSSIANSLRLLKLPDMIRNYLINEELSMGHARALLAVEEKEVQLQIAKDIVEQKLSVRDIEELIKKMKEFSGAGEEVTKVTGLKENAARDSKETIADLLSLQERLKRQLRMKVKIKGNNKRGKISIAYHTEDELGFVVDKLLSEK